MVERLTGALRVTGLIPLRNKYLCDLQLQVHDLAICVLNVCKRTHDTEVFPSPGQN